MMAAEEGASLGDDSTDVVGFAMSEVDRLTEIDLFHGLSGAELDLLSTHLRRRTIPAGSVVTSVEQPGEVVYFVMDGAVKIHVEQAEGADVILSILGPGEVVGEMSVVDSLGRSASVETLEETTLYWMDRSAFWDCLRSMPQLGFNLTSVLSRRLRLANERIQALATLDVYGRVARHILALAHEYGEQTPEGDVRIPIRLTQTDLASIVSASRVRVNQVMQSYKRRKWISVDRGYCTIVHQREALAARCQ